MTRPMYPGAAYFQVKNAQGEMADRLFANYFKTPPRLKRDDVIALEPGQETRIPFRVMIRKDRMRNENGNKRRGTILHFGNSGFLLTAF